MGMQNFVLIHTRTHSHSNLYLFSKIHERTTFTGYETTAIMKNKFRPKSKQQVKGVYFFKQQNSHVQAPNAIYR